MSVKRATARLFERYLSVIRKTADPDPFEKDPRLSMRNLEWLCLSGITQPMTLDKMSRWLGFVQGCLAMRGLINVDEERAFSRKLFHQCYEEAGLEKQKTLVNDYEVL